ncbi:tetratricopeptide repeat protein [Nostoc sp.]|uniref:tetratricopeptide repeat protein n=1 Tax=Nostoc sp. TaxID=1180 RepID=UPI003FA59648
MSGYLKNLPSQCKYIENLNVPSAISDFNQASESNFSLGSGIELISGLVYSKIGDKQRAIEYYTEALRINPKHITAYFNRGVERSEIGDNQGAVEDYSEIIRINPNYVMAYFFRGLARSKIGDNQGAVEDYTKGLWINPNDAIAYFHQSIARSEIGDKHSALLDLDKAGELFKQQGDEENYEIIKTIITLKKINERY